jgi:hypothetical protein
VIETAFGDDERQLARISRHLCPSALGHELRNLAGSVEVHITHIKPGEMEAVMAEIGRLGSPHRISALAAAATMTLRPSRPRLRLSPRASAEASAKAGKRREGRVSGGPWRRMVTVCVTFRAANHD